MHGSGRCLMSRPGHLALRMSQLTGLELTHFFPPSQADEDPGMPPPPPSEEIPVASSAAVPDPAGSTGVPVFIMDAGTSDGSGSVGTAGTYFGVTCTRH